MVISQLVVGPDMDRLNDPTPGAYNGRGASIGHVRGPAPVARPGVLWVPGVAVGRPGPGAGGRVGYPLLG